MQLSRAMQSAVLAFSAACCLPSVNASAQMAAQPVHTDVQPFVTFASGPALLQSDRFNNGGIHPAIELSFGGRKRVGGSFGVVLSANAGKMLETVIGGDDAVCRLRVDGKPGCYPNSPIISWFGASVGGEAYLGRTILGLQFGPTAVSAPDYERQLIAGSPSREWGLRTQFEANLPLYRQLGINLSAVDRYIPSILNDKWHITTVSVGLTLRAFHQPVTGSR